MSIAAWRIFKARHAATAFTGKGAREFGGRWNSRGTSVIYCAGAQSLAALELLVHLSSLQVLEEYQMVRVEFDDGLIERLDAGVLPTTWRDYPAPATLAAIGDAWAINGRSVVLQIPSALVPDENNYLLNPTHPDFRKLKVGKPQSFQFDRRLAK